MKLTTQSVLNQLPISTEIRDKILSKLESADQDTKFALEREIWDVHFLLQDLNLKDNIQKKLEEIKKEKGEIGNDFYEKVFEETEKQANQTNLQSADTEELKNIRSKLQNLIK